MRDCEWRMSMGVCKRQLPLPPHARRHGTDHTPSPRQRVDRLLGSFDCGAILNLKTAVSQFRGEMIMGLGLALTEETLFDERSDRIMNPTLADCHIPSHLDVPEIDVM